MSIDQIIERDLAALRDDSRRNLVGLDDALRTTNMYRDDRPGAEARRDALADERRRELAMMPLTLSHVFAHRVARAATGGAALLSTLVLIAMIADPLLMRFAAWLVPGLNLGMLVMLTAAKLLAVYVIATWFAEAWFARKMRAAIGTGNDAYADLDQLARGPTEVAQQAVRRVDAPSLGLFLGGITTLALAFGYITAIVGARHQMPYAWSITGLLGDGALERNVDVLLIPVIGAATLAFYAARACRDGKSALVALLGHWAALPVAFVTGIVTAYGAFHLLITLNVRRELPSADLRYMLAFGAAAAIMIAATWALLWLRRREQRSIDDER